MRTHASKMQNHCNSWLQQSRFCLFICETQRLMLKPNLTEHYFGSEKIVIFRHIFGWTNWRRQPNSVAEGLPVIAVQQDNAFSVLETTSHLILDFSWIFLIFFETSRILIWFEPRFSNFLDIIIFFDFVMDSSIISCFKITMIDLEKNASIKLHWV
jgi:hypothetical protein